MYLMRLSSWDLYLYLRLRLLGLLLLGLRLGLGCPINLLVTWHCQKRLFPTIWNALIVRFDERVQLVRLNTEPRRLLTKLLLMLLLLAELLLLLLLLPSLIELRLHALLWDLEHGH